MSEPIPNHQHVLIPAGQSTHMFQVRATYLEGQIALKRFRSDSPQYTLLHIDPLIIEPEKGGYAAITKFGAVIFWNCSDKAREEILSELEHLPNAQQRNPNVQDELAVHMGGEADQVTFSEIRLRDLTVEKLKFISLALGQSVALERFEIELTEVLRQFEPVVAELRKSGGLLLSKKEVLMHVGFAMQVRSAILANLTLFDAPPEAWESEALAHLDSQLYDYFDLDERLAAINQKVAYLTDANSILTTMLNTKKSERLEWIVIILIAIEIVIFLWMDILPKFF